MRTAIKFVWFPCVFAFVIGLSWSSGALAGESYSGSTKDAGDYYLVDGKEIGLLRATEELAVRSSENYTLGECLESISSAGVLEEVVSVGSFEPGGVAVVRADEEKRGELLAQDSVSDVYPVLVCPSDGAWMIPTDEILLCLDGEDDIDGLRATLDSIGVEIVEREPATDLCVYLLRLTGTGSVDALSASRGLSNTPGVRWAEPNFVRQIFHFSVPDDPFFSHQQSHHNTGQNGGTVDADVDAPEAWDITMGSPDVVVAIIDDGVDTGHQDLNIQPGGYDFYGNDSNPDPEQSGGHGTGCAGVTAAIGNNGYRIAGIAPQCRILPVRISGPGGFTTSEIIGNAIRYAADRADVLSNSWGGGTENSYINSAIDYAVTSGRNGKGCPVFFASGNSASGWYQGGGRMRLSLAGLSGQYYFGFTYVKDAEEYRGSDCVWIDNVSIIEGDGYTHRWREAFEGSFPPGGWAMAGYWQDWQKTSSGALKGTGGIYSARSGAIRDNQWTMLLTPLRAINGSETLALSLHVSSEQNYDGLYIVIYDSGWNYVGEVGPISGVPSVATAVSYPASYANSIAVGSSTDCDYRSDYSQYGSELDFLAPSNGGWNDIASLDPRGAVGWNDTDYKYNFGGTSSACPLAAGIAGLMLSYNSNLTAAGVRSIMRKSCDKIGGVAYGGGEPGAGGRHDEYGYGRINARLALLNSQAPPASPTPPPPSPSPSPSPSPTRPPGDDGGGDGTTPDQSRPLVVEINKSVYTTSDTITIVAHAAPASGVKPYIRFVTPAGLKYYVSSGGVTRSTRAYIDRFLNITQPVSNYHVATINFSRVAPGDYVLEAAFVSGAGIVGEPDVKRFNVR